MKLLCDHKLGWEFLLYSQAKVTLSIVLCWSSFNWLGKLLCSPVTHPHKISITNSLVHWSPLIVSWSYWEHKLTPMLPLMMQVALMPLSLVSTQTLLIFCSTWWTKLSLFQISEAVVIVNHMCIQDCEEWREGLASFPGLHLTNTVAMDIEGLVKLLRRWCQVDVRGHGISGLCQGTLQQLAHNDWKINIKQSWWRSSCSESHSQPCTIQKFD